MFWPLETLIDLVRLFIVLFMFALGGIGWLLTGLVWKG
jgi:hypothetical protein